MGSGSSKKARGETFSLEQVTVVPALEQADGKADQPRGTAGNESGMQNVSDEKGNSGMCHLPASKANL